MSAMDPCRVFKGVQAPPPNEQWNFQTLKLDKPLDCKRAKGVHMGWRSGFFPLPKKIGFCQMLLALQILVSISLIEISFFITWEFYTIMYYIQKVALTNITESDLNRNIGQNSSKQNLLGAVECFYRTNRLDHACI